MYSAAHMIFLPIQSILFVSCDVTAMSGCHPSFFMANLMISLVQIARLAPADISMSNFAVDTMVLVTQALIYFCPARMIF